MRPIRFNKREKGIQVLTIALALGSFTSGDPIVYVPLLASSWLCIVYLAYHHEGPAWKRTMTVTLTAMVFGFVGYREQQYAQNLGQILDTIQHPKPSQTAVFLECKKYFLPISVPDSDVLNLVAINKRQILDNNSQWMGFVEASGGEKHLWPENLKYPDPDNKDDPWAPGIVYGCLLTNHGPTTLIHLEMPLELWFGNDSTNKIEKVHYSIVVSGVEPNGAFLFYVVNACDAPFIGFWQDHGSAIFIEDAKPRTISIHRTYTKPVERLMVIPNLSARSLHVYPKCD